MLLTGGAPRYTDSLLPLGEVWHLPAQVGLYWAALLTVTECVL